MRAAAARQRLDAARPGISHNEIENARPQDLADGCDVLLRAVLDAAGRA